MEKLKYLKNPHTEVNSVNAPEPEVRVCSNFTRNRIALGPHCASQ